MQMASPTVMERLADARMEDEDVVEALSGAGALEGRAVEAIWRQPADDPQMDRVGPVDLDLSSGVPRYSPRPRVPHKLDPYKELIVVRLVEFLGCRRSGCSTRCARRATTAATAG